MSVTKILLLNSFIGVLRRQVAARSRVTSELLSETIKLALDSSYMGDPLYSSSLKKLSRVLQLVASPWFSLTLLKLADENFSISAGLATNFSMDNRS